MRRLDSGLVWFRRDLRLLDHAALSHALRECRRVHCAFVFDRGILDALPSPRDRRVEFIRESLVELDQVLRGHSGAMIAVHGDGAESIVALAARLQVDAVYLNRDYEPAAIERDDRVARALEAQGQQLRTFKDQAIFERDEILSGTKRPYSIFTPYRNAWERALGADATPIAAHPVLPHVDALAPPPDAMHPAEGLPASVAAARIPTLESMGFERTNLSELPLGVGISGGARLLAEFRDGLLGAYRTGRERPAIRGSSLLSVHLRFGTVSVRECARIARASVDAEPQAADGARTWLSELTWRDFFFQTLWHMPHSVDRPCKPVFEKVRFEEGPQADALFDAWAQGRTGYPIVDAGMRQMAATGFMHNRTRMVVASFFCKQLGLHWKRGERFFADHLNDYDLSANVGNWQWAASTGCDAQPWFRIFNPITQSEKFDGRGQYVRQWVPELARLPDAAIHAPWAAGADTLVAAGVRLGAGKDYPLPVVDHVQARAKSLARYSVVKGSGSEPDD